MSSINLKRFVNINIQKKIEPFISGTRDTVALFTAEPEPDESLIPTDSVFSSMSDITEEYAETHPNVVAYLTVYFNNGGSKVKVYHDVTHLALTKQLVEALDNRYICIAYASGSANKEQTFIALKTLAISMQPTDGIDTISDIYGINEKLILSSTHSYPVVAQNIKNFVVKYSDVQGAEMTVAAYLSRINVYGIDTVYDYAFTQETLAAEDITDETYNSISSSNANVDVFLAGAVRNLGGNCFDGSDIVNTYVRIILHQTLTDRLVALLTTKLKDSVGVSKIYTVMTDELEKYKTSGYLTTDKIWSKDTLSIEYNDMSYQIIEKGTPLTNGYFIKILPMSSLTVEDKVARKAPPIYVILADQYGIRQITINGDII